MEFLKIGENKLKVRLSADDIKKYKLTGVEADSDLSVHKRSFFRIIDIAEREVGFSAGSDKLLLQFYPSSDGGELFVTRLLILTEAKRNIISKAANLSTLARGRRVYCFDSIFDAIALCRSIAARTAPPENSVLYISEEGIPVMEIEECMSGADAEEFFEAAEFAEPVFGESIFYLREHSVTVFPKNAVKKLSELKI